MRKLSISFLCLTIALCFILVACGDDDNPIGSPGSLPTFWKTYDFGLYETFTSLEQDAGGAIVVGGTSEMIIPLVGGPITADTNNQAIVVQCNSAGDTTWTNIFGIQTYAESIADIIADNAGGYLAVVADIYMGGPGSDFSVQQISGSGALGSANLINDTQFDDVHDISTCSDGNFLLSGRYGNFGISDRAYVGKVLPSTNIVWQNTYSHTDSNLTVERIMELPDSSLLAAGFYNPADGTGQPLYILRLDAAGSMLYDTVIALDGYSNVLDIAATSDGGYKILLFQRSSQYHCAVTWFDNSGALKTIQYSYKDPFYIIESGQFLPDGGAVLCGKSLIDLNSYAGLLLKLDETGRIEWEQEFEDPAATLEFNCVIDYAPGGYIIAGSREFYSGGGYESLLIRTDESGNVTDAP